MSWRVASIIEELKDAYRGVRCALACVSGGVDSAVAAILAKKALGDRVYSVFIDTGFMREGEAEFVRESLKGLLDVEVYDYSEEVVSAVEGLEDAEEKRKAFRDAFYKSVKSIADEKGCEWIVQGTIKADVIETSSGIKTQHNVLNNELLGKYGLRVIEPLRNLYKHEVRELANYLGISKSIVERQPFPGPGLCIRAVGKLTREKLNLVRKATSIVERYLEGRGYSQYFPAIWEYSVIEKGRLNGIEYDVFSVKVTGISSGCRSYGNPVVITNWHNVGVEVYELYKLFNTNENPHVLIKVLERNSGMYLVALRAVVSKDFMTAEVPRVDLLELGPLCEEITSFPEIRAIAFDVTPKPPATIEYE